MKIRDLMSFLAFGLIVAFALGYIAMLGVRPGAPSNRTNITMDVADINNLVVGSNVLLRGVPVGKVSKIETSLKTATIGFYVDNRFHVPVDTDVRLDNLSALGEAYIGLMPRSEHGPTLHDGEHIGTEAVIQPPSISELATSVVRVLNQTDPVALAHIVDQADTALPDANVVLPNLSRASWLLRNTAANMNGQGRAMLDNFQTLLRNASWVGPVLATLGPQVRDIGRYAQTIWYSTIRMRYNGGPEFEVKFKDLLDRIQRLLDNNGGDLRVLGDAFLPKVQAIAGALMNFDPAQILGNIMNSVPEDGAITLHVAVPPP